MFVSSWRGFYFIAAAARTSGAGGKMFSLLFCLLACLLTVPLLEESLLGSLAWTPMPPVRPWYPASVYLLLSLL